MAYFSILETNGRKAILLHGLSQNEREIQAQSWSIHAWNQFLGDLDFDSGLFTTLTFENVLEAEERAAHPQQWIEADADQTDPEWDRIDGYLRSQGVNPDAEPVDLKRQYDAARASALRLEAELERLELDHELTLRRDHETIVSLRETRDELEAKLEEHDSTVESGKAMSFADLATAYANQARTIREFQGTVRRLREENLANDHDRIAELTGALEESRATSRRLAATIDAKDEELRSYVESGKKQAETITEYQRRTKQFADGTPISAYVFPS